MILTRHQKRSTVVQALFLWEQREKDNKKALKQVIEAVGDPTDLPDFENELMQGVVQHIDELKTLIAKYAPEWPIEKIAPTDRVILYLALYEMLHTKTPNPIVINEAVDLAKEFGGNTSYKFINGALSSANKDVEKSNQGENR